MVFFFLFINHSTGCKISTFIIDQNKMVPKGTSLYMYGRRSVGTIGGVPSVIVRYLCIAYGQCVCVASCSVFLHVDPLSLER